MITAMAFARWMASPGILALDILSGSPRVLFPWGLGFHYASGFVQDSEGFKKGCLMVLGFPGLRFRVSGFGGSSGCRDWVHGCRGSGIYVWHLGLKVLGS